MKKYHFKLGETIFNAPKDISYDEVQHKILNEHISDINIIVLSENIEGAKEKVNNILKEIVSLQFSEFPMIQFYKIVVKVYKIEEIE